MSAAPNIPTHNTTPGRRNPTTESGVFPPDPEAPDTSSSPSPAWMSGCPPALLLVAQGVTSNHSMPPQGSRSNTNGQPDMHGRTKRTRQFLFNFCSYCIELRFDGDRGIAGRSGGMRCNTITHPLAHTDTSSILNPLAALTSASARAQAQAHPSRPSLLNPTSSALLCRPLDRLRPCRHVVSYIWGVPAGSRIPKKCCIQPANALPSPIPKDAQIRNFQTCPSTSSLSAPASPDSARPWPCAGPATGSASTSGPPSTTKSAPPSPCRPMPAAPSPPGASTPRRPSLSWRKTSPSPSGRPSSRSSTLR